MRTASTSRSYSAASYHERIFEFKKALAQILPSSRIISDPTQRFAMSTDASFYRLVPEVVLKVDSEKEVLKIIPLAQKFNVPITFRTAGTSLSGQAITDSVLVKLTSKYGRIQLMALPHPLTVPELRPTANKSPSNPP